MIGLLLMDFFILQMIEATLRGGLDVVALRLQDTQLIICMAERLPAP